MSSNKTIRLRTTPGSSKNIQVKIEQEFDTLDVLSLKITQQEAYRNFCSDYGVVVGRVIANDGFGVENAKVSIFIPLSDVDAENPKIENIYPYRSPNQLNGQGTRYNLLPKDGREFYIYEKIPLGSSPEGGVVLSGTPNSIYPVTETYFNEPYYTPLGTFVSSWEQSSTINDDDTVTWKRKVKAGHGPKVPVGTTPSKSEMLDNDILLEVYEKYYKLTTRTNISGDYMIFGVPIGNQTVHMDVDLSDAGATSLNVQDFLNAGLPSSLFSGNNFKSSTNLDSLPQIEGRDVGVEVVPFWGNPDQCELGITRLDFNLSKVITPSATIIFQAFTNKKGWFKKGTDCNIGDSTDFFDAGGKFGDIRQMVTLPVKVKSIPLDGGISRTESFGDGNVVMTLPLASDLKITNEFGQIVDSPDGLKGIPTNAIYRFMIWGSSTHMKSNQTEGQGTARYYTQFPIEMKFDLLNKKRLIYTIGNYNNAATSGPGTGAYRKVGIKSGGGDGIVRYPASWKGGGDTKFGGGSVCYGSLYFPRFEVKNEDFCNALISYDDTNFQGEEFAGFSYHKQRLDTGYYLDITDIINDFKPFGGGLDITSAGVFSNGPQINAIDNNNNLNRSGETIPLKNALNNGNADSPLAENRLDTIGDVSYTNIIHSSFDGPNDFPHWSSLSGRYNIYFGLFDNDNALTAAKEVLDV